MNKPIFVGHVIRQYLRLTETFIQSYLAHAQKHHPHVFTDVLCSEAADDIPCVYLIDQEQIAQMGQQQSRFFFSQLDYPNCYAETIVERQVRVLHAHFGLVGCRTLKLKRKVQLPLVVSFYGIDASHLLGLRRWQKPFRQLFDQADVVTTLGADMANRLCDAGCSQKKIQIVHLGVDLESIPFHTRIWPGSDERIVLLYCGRLVEKKGIFDALDAFARVTDQWPNLFFRVIGDGVLRSQLRRVVHQRGLDDRVALCGALPHDRVLQEMAKAHVFILPSKTAKNGDKEGTPTVLLEAQASGLPVLSTYHADIPEVVRDGVSGFLVAEGDGHGLAEKLKKVLEQPHLWPQFGQAGHKHIQIYYNIHQEVKKIEMLYQKLV